MHTHVTAPRDGIVVAHGYGLKIHVSRGHLVVHDGICDERQTRRFHRATSKLRRLVVIGVTGYVTLEAMRWLRDVNAAFVQLDADGSLIAVSVAQSPDLPRLRRAQALAADSSLGLELARGVLGEKIAGQATLFDHLREAGRAQPGMRLAIRDLDNANTFDELQAAEAHAAATYWDAWSTIPVRFGRSDERCVPDHWRTFGQRHSPLTRSPRLAANPPNAILNYLYALLEVETIIACQTVGLDPGLGIFHADRGSRASLALDLMEAARPAVDAYLLALLSERTLSARDFVETRRGACRIMPTLAKQLAGTTGVWASLVAPVVEQAVRMLHAGAELPGEAPTRLTRQRHIAAWEDRRTTMRAARVKTAALPATCRDCGHPLPTRRHRYCADCRAQQFSEGTPAARATGQAVLAQFRAAGSDPAHGGRAATLRGAKNAAHQRAVRDWEGERPDPALFRAEVLPGLRDRSIAELVAATGLSAHYCSLIRLGKKVPHARHWETLRASEYRQLGA